MVARRGFVDEVNNARVVKRMLVTQPVETLRECVVGLFTLAPLAGRARGLASVI